MEFTNKGLSGILTLVIIFTILLLTIKLLPIVIVGGLLIYAIYKSYNFVKAHFGKKNNSFEKITVEDEFDMNKDQVIDVEYEDVK